MLQYKVIARPSPVSAHSISKRIPPAKKKKHGKAETGRGRTRGTPRGRRSSYHGIGAYEKVPSHHARGACEVSPKWRNGSERSTIETPESNSIPFCRFQNARHEAPRRGEWGFRALRTSKRFKKIQIRKLFGGGLEGNANPTAGINKYIVECFAPPARARTSSPSLAVFRKHCKTAGMAPRNGMRYDIEI